MEPDAASEHFVLPYVADVLRALVGDDQLTYYGASYGTFLGSTYAAVLGTATSRSMYTTIKLEWLWKPGYHPTRQYLKLHAPNERIYRIAPAVVWPAWF